MLWRRKHALTRPEEKDLVRRPLAETMGWPTPSDWMRRFSEDVDRWFGTWGPREMWPFSGRSLTWMPDVDVIERQGTWRHGEAVEFATLERVDWFNHRRLLEPIGNVPPAEYEARYYEQAGA